MKSKEMIQVMSAAAAVRFSGAGGERLNRLMADIRDVSCLIDAAARHGMVCVLYRSLRDADLLRPISYRNQNRLTAYYYRTAAENTARMADLDEILQAASGIPVVLLQGAALLEDTYADDIALRPMTDLDLWVPLESYTLFSDTLQHLGYREDPVYLGKFHRQGTIVDVRSRLLWADRIRSRRHLLRIEEDRVFKRSVLFSARNWTARRLQTPDQAIYLCLHALKHGIDRLLWLYDLLLLMRSWNEREIEAFCQGAAEWGVQRPIRFVLAVMDRSGFLPPSVREGTGMWMQNRPGQGLHWLDAWEQNGKWQEGVADWILSSDQSWPIRLLHMTEVIFPLPNVIREIYAQPPDSPTFRLYARRAADVASKLRLTLRR